MQPSHLAQEQKGRAILFMAKTRKSLAAHESAPNNSVYEVLVERITMGEYAPGANLSESDLAAELGVSRTPVREAFLRLKIEGLVKIVPRGGIFVAEPTLRRVREVTGMRLVLEEYLAHLVVRHRTDAWLRKYEDWLRTCSKSWPSLSSQEWMQKDGQFHLLLEEAAGDEVLAEHLGVLRRQAVLFWGQTHYGRASLKSIIGDFEEFLPAAQQSDATRCVQILHRHILAHIDRIHTYMRPEMHSFTVSSEKS